MPLPLGHTAIGLAINDIYPKGSFTDNPWKPFVFVVALSNLPDIDVITGLMLYGNGDVFHRGPTHSLLFGLIMALIASRVGNWWSKISGVSFFWCFLVIFSHVLADAILTHVPVSLWWPLELNCSGGYSGWVDVINFVVFGAIRDVGIIVTVATVIVFNRIIRHKPLPFAFSRLLKGR